MTRFMLCMALLIAITSCKKTKLEYVDNSPSLENGITLATLKNVPIINSFSKATIPALNYDQWDSTAVRGYRALSTLKVDSKDTLPKDLYLANAPSGLGIDQAEQYFQNKGYTMAPWWYVGGAIKKYAYSLTGFSLSFNVPIELDFGYGNGVEPAFVQIGGFNISVWLWFGEKNSTGPGTMYLIMKKK